MWRLRLPKLVEYQCKSFELIPLCFELTLCIGGHECCLIFYFFRYKRDGWLGKVTKDYKLIAVSGSHGSFVLVAI